MDKNLSAHHLEAASPLMDLFWYDGPVVSLYRAADQSLYFRVAEHLRDTIEEWLWVASSHAHVIAFLREQIDLLTCFEDATEMFMETVSADGRQWRPVTFDDLEDDFLPEAGCVLVTDGNLDVAALVALQEGEKEAA